MEKLIVRHNEYDLSAQGVLLRPENGFEECLLSHFFLKTQNCQNDFRNGLVLMKQTVIVEGFFKKKISEV